MAYVRVEQRNARLAAAVRLDTVQGKDGPITKGTAVAISNARKGSGEQRKEEAISIQWTFWGKVAETAAKYLDKGSRVNIVGRLQNNNYQGADGEPVYGLTFTCEEIDFLDSRADAEARLHRQTGSAETATDVVSVTPATAKTNGAKRPARKSADSAKTAKGVDEDDIPF